MKKYKFTVAYSLDSTQQFKHFEKSFKLLTATNFDFNSDYIVRVFINEKNKNVISKIEELLKKHNYVNSEIISNTNNIFKKWAANRNPMIWWVYFPWIINDSKYLLSIDNDTLPKIKLINIFNEAELKIDDKEFVILQRKVGFSWRNGRTSKMKEKMISVQKNGKEIDSRVCGNGGFVVSNIEGFKNKFSELYSVSNISEFRKLANKFIFRINWKMFTWYLSDEAFITYFLNKNISNSLDNKWNFGQHSIEFFESFVESEDLNLHFFLRDRDNKKVLLYEFFEFENENQIQKWKDNFLDAMKNFNEKQGNNFSNIQIEEFLKFIYEKLEEFKSIISN